MALEYIPPTVMSIRMISTTIPIKTKAQTKPLAKLAKVRIADFARMSY